MATKYLDYTGLEYIITKLYERGFNGMGLSHEDFTAELKAKYDALVAASSVEDLTELFNRVSQLEALVDSDSDQTINKFNEIVTFLAGIGPSDTLDGKLSDIATQIAAAKKVGDDAAAALAAHKAEVNGPSGKVDKVAGKGLSTNDYTDTDKDEVAKVKDKLNTADVTAITTADIDALLAVA